MNRIVLLPLVAIAVLAPSQVRSQEKWTPGSPRLELVEANLFTNPAQYEDSEDHYGRMAISGLIAGGAAMGIGWYAGRNLSEVGEGGILIAGLLVSAAIPIGAYFGNGRRGELPLALVASYGIGMAGLLAIGSSWTDSNVRNCSIIIPLTQLGASIWVIVKGID